MKVIPLAADSLGARSMATYVEVGGLRLLIDPGATLAPARYSLPPSDPEWEALRRANDRISAYASRASTVFVSHYHEDHFRSEPATYAGRRVLAKDPNRMVTGLQTRRGSDLWRTLATHARVERADGLAERDGDVELRVSPPLPHGMEGTAFGSIVALTVVDHAERERFVFASDVQGPMSPVVAAWLTQERPTLVYLSGPPSYIEHELGTPAIERAIDQLVRVVDRTGCRVIMDHHAVRDRHFGARFARLWDTGRVVTAAGYLGIADASLERRRPELWSEARKPPAKAASPRATMARAERRWPARTNRTSMKGGRLG
jgi:predicted metallo-beta-lactamase superfamily hydrolase